METRASEELSLEQQLEALRAEAAFLRAEIVRKDNNWTKSWQEMQARFNDKVAEVKLLREVVAKLELPKKELTYA